MNCAKYWESIGVDALDAMFSVGCPSDTAMSVTGADVIGGLLFFVLLVVGVVLAKGQGQL